MNYYQPRQREDSLRWDFTCKRDRQVWPIGYCSGKSHEGPHADKYHDDGHASAEEAAQCYRLYLLDNELRFDDGGDSRVLRVCQYPGCEEFTGGSATVGCGPCAVYSLCAEHRTREAVEEMFQAPDNIISSY
jgi:hypothetical protein